jgi:5'/3'-nucleotidase SurE
MRILVTNDDGINARGLKVLERIAKTISKDVWVVAPETEQSGASHSLTLHEPLRIRRLSNRRFAVHGTPTDCVMLAIHQIIKGRAPDLVLSGINRGANIGDDVTYSGTIAAAMEGTILGVPAIALSQSLRGAHPVKWSTAEHYAPDIVRRLLKVGWPEQVLININFPDLVEAAVKGIKVTIQGRRDVSDLKIEDRIDTRGIPYYWLGFRYRAGAPPAAESDLAAIAAGYVSMTPLQLDLTDAKTRRQLGKVFM